MLDKSILEKKFRSGNAYCSKLTTNTFTRNGRTIERVDFTLEYSELFAVTLNREKLVELQNVIAEALNQ